MSDDSRRVDRYIAESPEFARPILEKIRKAFHAGCPQVEEAIKWGTPHFMHQGMLGGMAAFKQHVGFGFWKSKLMDDPENLFGNDPKASMCTAKITSAKELPAQRVLVRYVKEAARLNEEGVKLPVKSGKTASPVRVPADLAAALKKNKEAKATFDDFSPSCRREYVEWITEAKQDATRKRRLQTTIEWLTEGKPRNWKYMKKGKL